MKKLLLTLLSVLILLMPLTATCQFHKISGTVLVFGKFPIKQLKVKAKKAKTEALTDSTGHFELVAKTSDIIQVNDPVFYPFSKKVEQQDSVIQIKLFVKNDDEDMQKAVDAGYISNSDMEYGKENLWQNNNIFYQFHDVYDAIKYALPEATIIYEGSTKGVEFRGTKSIYHSNRALIVVNGQVLDDPSDLQPATIYRITKLSTAAASLYGSRGANGVVSIETK